MVSAFRVILTLMVGGKVIRHIPGEIPLRGVNGISALIEHIIHSLVCGVILTVFNLDRIRGGINTALGPGNIVGAVNH